VSRYEVLREIERLDPARDDQRIVHLSFGYEFPWDSIRALEVALFRSYCVASISALLDRTGEFAARPQRRYDDTAILIAEICEWGYEQGRGRAALDRINWAHGHYRISNEDFLFVLSTFVYEPIRWIDRFGWRRLCSNERLAYYHFWRQVGLRMGIRDIPPSSEQFAAWSRQYERERCRFAATSQRIGIATRDLFASWFPSIAAPVVRHAVHAILDPGMRQAFGFPRPARGMTAMVHGALRLRGRVVRWLPPRRSAHFFTDDRNRTYPQGYVIEALGPPGLVAREQGRRQAGDPEA
jgi:hypothetical protein